MHKKRILSGMRPTGKLHLGHLVGALANWTKLQDEYDCFFMVADWHALMSEYENPDLLKDNMLDNVIDWLSCGIDPERSTIFIQSQVPEHLELYFIFSLITPLGLLERCPTYKEQLRQVVNRDLSTYAFLGYPVLQAADILLYKADSVPVGEDQLPHLELCRQIARKFNHLYKTTCFAEPKALLTQTTRLLGLDGRKMSKSYNNYIALTDAPEVIRKKVQSMFTDPERIHVADRGHPDKCNVFSYYAAFSPLLKDQVQERCSKAMIGCTECKKELTVLLTNLLAPIQEKRLAWQKDKRRIQEILSAGRQKASLLAKKTIFTVRELLKI
ncbi:MAG: tryptophan--tRNA ligase [Candidatus Omnitrophica bacterium]|nr:tryptophan--tRNA ligase [Candidatus Omnitrophota bacterium]MBU4302974.1 tryptophan--tRNA ligase [Candidatus Omnitrophota bacterium]MBU4419200.1 tryptophan--tRNA ligase [Candidatus Omnitrophota bacterium]MBU4467410.1 tryptophan--tRNA ligase [Candidatus Omnitrophota bacterium]MCG2708504.1 tryptophan--tRNA ligase [Candidatus Omnitrophota bacterium]